MKAIETKGGHGKDYEDGSEWFARFTIPAREEYRRYFHCFRGVTPGSSPRNDKLTEGLGIQRHPNNTR